MERRKFLKASAVISAPLLFKGIPVLASSALENNSFEILANAAAACGKVLVIIQMNGGNDGLNTVFPLDQWSKLFNARSNILMKESDVLPLNNNKETGLHPAMPELQKLYNEGQMMIVQGVSYPNPSFSHFRATDIMFTGSSSDKSLVTGWLGRTLNELYPEYPSKYPNKDMPDPLAIQIGSTLPFSLQGSQINMGYSVPNPKDLLDVINATSDPAPNSDYGLELTFLRLMKSQSNSYREAIQKAYNIPQSNAATYPNKNELANQLKIVAKLINGGLKTPIYIVNHPKSHDTHEGQVEQSDRTKGKHATNLSILSQAVGAFMQDLKSMGKAEMVTGMTHSEFGRRIKSNDSSGTDHGTAAPVFFFGDALNTNLKTVKGSPNPVPGMIGKSPLLPDKATVQDQVPMQHDFRQIYATIMQDWLCMTPAQVSSVLNGDFEKLSLFRNGPKETLNSLALNDLKNFFSIYPNPINNGQTINLAFQDIVNSTVKVNILNLQGQKVFSNNYTVNSDNLNLNISTPLPSAAYIVELIYNDNKFYKKLLVN